MISRREFLIAFGASTVAAPLCSFAQQKDKVWRVGFLSSRGRPASLESDALGAFPRGMRELGYVEGKNLVIEWRFADNELDRLSELAAELVQLKVDAIVAVTTPPLLAAQKATATIPIVMANVGDAVGSGFVRSLARPGGNITGVSNIAPDLGAKQLEMLLGVVPKFSRVAVLVNPDNPSTIIFLKNIQAAASGRNVKILPLEARSGQEVERAFSMMRQQKAQAVIAARDGLFTQQMLQIAKLAGENRLPSINGNPGYANVGGLMAYGSSPFDDVRRTATYVDKIFKGAKPRDLPIEQPTKFEMIVNLKTAKALGLKVPQSILLRADKVIE